MNRKNTLNNLIMSNKRRDPIYQTVITDLAIKGVISKEDAESLLGYEIPDFLHSPDNDTIVGTVSLEQRVNKLESAKPSKQSKVD